MKTKARRKRYKPQGLRKYSYADFLILFAACVPHHQQELMMALHDAKRPTFVLGKPVPENLNLLSYGQLEELSYSSESNDPICTAFQTILGLTPEQVYGINVVDVMGFGNFVNRELERINGLFESIQLEHTSEELAAGIEKLNFGAFGVLDWYARRMGMTNQNEVRDVAWVRIFTCMKNDNQQTAFERRLNKELTNRAKQRR